MNVNHMENFDPTRAIQTLKQNAIDLAAKGKELQAKRILFIQAKARLMDAEKEARDGLFKEGKEIKASLVRDWIKWCIAVEQKEHDLLQEEIRSLKEDMEIMIEVNNSLKASHRIIELEAKNMM